MSSRPIIALDMDGVMCCGPQTSHIKCINAKFGTSYTLAGIKTFSYSHMTPEEREYIFSPDCWHREDLYDDQPLSAENQASIDILREFARVIVVTSPLSGHIKSKYLWCQRYFEDEDIYLAKDKSLITADVLVDDFIPNLESFPGIGITFDQPWNQSWTGPRVTNFLELPGVVYDALQLDTQLEMPLFYEHP